MTNDINCMWVSREGHQKLGLGTGRKARRTSFTHKAANVILLDKGLLAQYTLKLQPHTLHDIYKFCAPTSVEYIQSKLQVRINHQSLNVLEWKFVRCLIGKFVDVSSSMVPDGPSSGAEVWVAVQIFFAEKNRWYCNVHGQLCLIEGGSWY